jgi:hypothetical protein
MYALPIVSGNVGVHHNMQADEWQCQESEDVWHKLTSFALMCANELISIHYFESSDEYHFPEPDREFSPFFPCIDR